jgi:hypothetical protein
MDSYNAYLKIIENDIGDQITTNHELDEYCTSVFPKYRGCYSLDTIPKLRNNESCIFNLDKSNQPGSHWMGLYKDKNKNVIYDSFGRSSKKLKIPLKLYVDTEHDAEQHVVETNCGARCIAFIACCYTLPMDEVLKI